MIYLKENKMGALELRDSVLKYINDADDRLLKVVKAFIETYQEEEIVAFDIDKKPISREAYKASLLEAEAEIKRGEYTNQDDLEKESQNW
ncbi:hypothetical protein [Flavobacterium sp. WC2509]|uniref:hypothetical protein n=1 Tax=Flavobacterium sp. WC2509 TaxID=3461406 RepID=UPI004044A32C